MGAPPKKRNPWYIIALSSLIKFFEKIFSLIRKGFLVIKRFRALLLIFILFLLITYNQIWSYQNRVSYEENMGLTQTDTTKKKGNISYYGFIKIKFDTRSAFLPYEKIKVYVSFMLMDTILRKRMRQPAEVMFSIERAYLTDSRINKDIKKRLVDEEYSTPQLRAMAKYSSGNVFFQLVPTDEPFEFEGECELQFYKPGKYTMGIAYDEGNGIASLPIRMPEIEIGSTIDLMNKKTNDLLFTLTVLNLILWLYTEIKQTLQNTGLKK